MLSFLDDRADRFRASDLKITGNYKTLVITSTSLSVRNEKTYLLAGSRWSAKTAAL